MKTKLIEIRDVGTFIPVLCVQVASDDPAERYLLGRVGYPQDTGRAETWIIVAKLAGGTDTATCDPYEWPSSSRTMQVAHEYIRSNWDKLETGDVVDVEFVMGQSAEPKRPERLERSTFGL